VTLLDLFLPAVDPAIDALHQATAFYTADAAVDALLDLTGWPERPGCLLDAGCGAGAITVRALARLPLVVDDVDTLSARLEAWEIHPFAAAGARATLAAHLHTRGWSVTAAARGATAVVREADFLTRGPTTRRYTAVAINPPFLRRLLVPDALRALYDTVVPAYARADMLHAFLDRCASLLSDDGVLAAVTSDRWLFSQSAAALRDRIGARFGIAALTPLDSVAAFTRAKTRRAGTPPRVSPVAVALSRAAQGTRPLTRAPIYPRATDTDLAGTVPLAACATVRLAPWLGTAGVFYMTGDAARAAGFPADQLVPCVDTDDIRAGTIHAPTRVALRTSRLVKPDPTIHAHLHATTPQLAPRAQRIPFWVAPESWGPLPFPHDAVLIPRIAKGLRPVRLPAHVLPIDHNLTVVSSAMSVEALIAALTTDEAQAWIAARAPRLENGYFSITTTLLRQLPVRMVDTHVFAASA